MDFVTETWLHAAASGAGAALLLAAAAAGAAGRLRLERGLCVALAALGVAAFLNFGALHHQFDRGFVHRWEHFHYHLGSKYFPELGYDGLYVASLAAQHASHPQLPVGRRLRDLRTRRGRLGASPPGPQPVLARALAELRRRSRALRRGRRRALPHRGPPRPRLQPEPHVDLRGAAAHRTRTGR